MSASDEAVPSATPSPTPTTPRTAEVLLGVFICGQLWFLLSHNLFGQLEELQQYTKEEYEAVGKSVELLAPGFSSGSGKGHIIDAAGWVRKVNKPWEQLTGQLQMWSLFPNSYHELIFPAIALRWDSADDGDYPATDNPDAAGVIPGRPYRLFLTPHEPRDTQAYFRWRQMRMRRLENYLVFALRPDGYDKDEDRKRAWTNRIREHLTDRGELIPAYMKLRLCEIMAEHPELPPPTQVVLLMRRFHTRNPSEAPPHWDGPFVVPLLSWLPPAPGEKAPGKQRRFDPEVDRFRSWE